MILVFSFKGQKRDKIEFANKFDGMTITAIFATKKKNSQIAQGFFPTSVVSLITSNTKPQIKQFGECS